MVLVAVIVVFHVFPFLVFVRVILEGSRSEDGIFHGGNIIEVVIFVEASSTFSTHFLFK